MSDPSDTTSTLTGPGESPRGGVEPRANWSESSVETGKLEARRETAPRDMGVDVEQLALALAARLKEQEPEPERPMLGELADAWLKDVAPRRVCVQSDLTPLAHLRPLFLDDESTLTVGAVTDLLEALRRDGYAAGSINKVRATGRRIVEHAQAHRQWTGPNPFSLARRHREPERTYETLTLEELDRVGRQLAPDRRRLFRVALHLGLRTGELLSLRRGDVDFDAATVRVHRSHGRDTTKTGRERTIPLHPACAGDLLEASLSSGSDLVFGGEDGERQRADVKLTRALRTAMGRAGVGVVSVTYKCRRRGCDEPEHTREADHVEKLDCPRCGMRLWPIPEVRPFRWYDLRHMCATLHHQHGADPLCVALALGHAVRDTTRRVYTHVGVEEMRRELTRWRLP